MSFLPPEIQGQLDPKQNQAWADRDDVRRAVNGLGTRVIPAGAPIIESALNNNAFFLLEGRHGGMTLSKPGTRISCAPGAVVTRHARFDSTASISGLNFVAEQGGNNGAALITIGPDAVVIFDACRFIKDSALQANFVTVENGGKAVFSACDFGGAMNLVGNVFTNPGVITDVQITGANRTGNALGNVTAVGVV